MKKLTLAIVALAAGAGAMYYLDPRHGHRRRAEVQQRLTHWRHVVSHEAHGRGTDLGNRLSGLLARGRRLMERMGRESELPGEDAALEPLSFAPQPLEREPAAGGSSKLLPLLAAAAPVAMAVGAAVLSHRRHDGEWLH